MIKWYLKRELHTKIRSNFGEKTDANSHFFPRPQNCTAVSSFPTNAYVWLLAWITNYTNSCLCVFYTGKIKSWCPTPISFKGAFTYDVRWFWGIFDLSTYLKIWPHLWMINKFFLWIVLQAGPFLDYSYFLRSFVTLDHRSGLSSLGVHGTPRFWKIS